MSESKRHARLTQLFLAASELPASEVAAFLARECGGDAALRAEVEAMLESDRQNASFLERPVMPRPDDGNMTTSARIGLGPDSDQTGPIDPAHLPKIEGYRITGVLGHGGMGIVYRAVQTTLNRPVALKVLPAMIGSTSPSAVTRFKREATAAARLHHTNIVAIHDFGQSHDTYFYAMELIEGRPLNLLIKNFAEEKIAVVGSARLSAVIQQCVRPDRSSAHDSNLTGDSSGVTPGTSHSHGRPYFHQVARWMADAADALHYAHGQGIVHRDIKPANIILAADRRIMITDFGLAKSSDEASVTITGSLIGTIRYLSPEQAMAKRVPVDHRTDVYSLGATMYELLCFQPAFPGSDDKQVLAAIIARDPVQPRKILSVVPAELETICLKTLEKLPEKRYATARELSEDLRRYLQNVPIVAKRPGLIERTVKYARRHRATTVACVSAAALAIVLVGLYYALFFLKDKTIEGLKKDAIKLTVDGQFKQAEQTYEKLLLMHSDWPWSWINVGDHRAKTYVNLAILQKDWFNASKPRDSARLQKALFYLKEAESIEPDRWGVFNTRGVVCKILDRPDEALAAYLKATEIRPKDPVSWDNLANFRAIIGELDAAEVDLRHAIQLELEKRIAGEKIKNDEAVAADDQVPFCAPWRDLAVLQLARGNVNEAWALADQAVTCETQRDANPSSYYVRALVGIAKGTPADMRKAWGDANVAKENSREQSALALRVYALANLKMGYYSDAIQAAKAALTALGDGELACPIHLIIAAAEGRHGNKGEARAAFHEAMKAWPLALCDPDNCPMDAYLATSPKGMLWIETAREITSLRLEVEELLSQ